MYFVFFKQKTAYEMRISDWSSDVCSSDLSTKRAFRRHSSHSSSTTESATMPEPTPKTADPSLADVSGVSRRVLIATLNRERQPPLPPSSCPAPRSEEHTSELQSLMRISYAVFCLKKTKEPTHIKNTEPQSP